MTSTTPNLNIEELCKQFPRVFADDLGHLEGKYHIKLNVAVTPVQHTPQHVPVALRDQLKAKLNKMVEQGIIAPVTVPIPWVNSLVVVAKKNGKLRLCLESKYLN